MDPIIRVIPGVHVVPYQQPDNNIKAPKPDKEEHLNLSILVQRLSKDPPPSEHKAHQFKNKKKKKSSLYELIQSSLYSSDEQAKPKAIKSLYDLSHFIENTHCKLNGALATLQELLAPLKKILQAPHPQSKEFSLHLLQLSTEMFIKIQKDLLKPHLSIQKQLKENHEKLIAHCHSCILKVQSYLSQHPTLTPSSYLQPLFDTLKSYEEKYHLYLQCLSYLSQLIESYKKEETLTFFMKQSEKQLQQLEKTSSHHFHLSHAENQLKFLEQMIQQKEKPHLEPKKLHPANEMPKPDQISAIKQNLHQFKLRLSKIKKKL